MTEGLTIFGKTVFDTLFIDWRIMAAVAAFSVIMFIVGIYLQLDKWGRGIPEGATKPVGAWGTLELIIHKVFERGIGPALGIIILDGLFQRRTWRRRKTEWLMHILLFWGWMGLFILTITAATAEFYGPFIKGANYTFFAGAWQSLELPNNIFAYMLTLGVIIAIVRRVAFADVPPARFTSVDWVTILGIGIIVFTGFWAQDYRIGLGIEQRTLSGEYANSFFDNPLDVFHEVFSLLFAVAYLPFGKLFHMFVAPLTIMINKGGYVEVNP